MRGGSSVHDELTASIKSNRHLDSRRETIVAQAEKKISAGTETNSFVEQIRRKFTDQKYMKREDVLKMLKQMQGGEQEKGRKKIFDHSEIFKYIDDQKLFNMTTQQ